MQDPPVKSIMTTGLITVKVHESISKVAEIFKTQSFHHIPIVNDDECLKGIISLTDFERIKNGTTLFRNPKIEAYNKALFETLLAEDVMTKDVIALRPTDTISQAYKIFKNNKFRAIPVIDKGKLAGIVSPLDILDYFFQENQIKI